MAPRVPAAMATNLIAIAPPAALRRSAKPASPESRPAPPGKPVQRRRRDADAAGSGQPPEASPAAFPTARHNEVGVSCSLPPSIRISTLAKARRI